ncbi:MAG: nucleotidyltransferase family protein [Candidatus Sumerlaeota bacterium]|nr:nucleotidyltransferase family protein [Candidatus Sumerlaeota bacterium]
MPELSEIRKKRQRILDIAANHGGREIRLFGSVARGESGPKSDVDLLINLSPGRSLLDMVAIKQDLEDYLGYEVHVVTEASLSPYLRERVLREAASL